MLYLYLDESGDLGFDFVNKKPSVHFTVCVVAVRGRENDQILAKAVRGVIRRKLRPAPKTPSELKGNSLPMPIKEYFFKKAARAAFEVHSATLNKISLCLGQKIDKDRLYNYLSNLALESVSLEDAAVPLDIVHVLSQESCGLQAADMFAWGIFRKYEHGDAAWFGIFRSRVKSDRLYAYKKEEERAA